MDNKQMLEELEKRSKELIEKIEKLNGDIKTDSLYDEFEATQDENEKMEKYPELYAKSQELDKLYSEDDALVQECFNKAKEVAKDISEKIAALEKKIEINAKIVEETMKEIKEKDEEIRALKETEEYKNNDEAMILKVQKLEWELNAKIVWKNNIVEGLRKKRQEINQLEAEKEELVNWYGEEVLEEAEVPHADENKETKDNSKDETEEHAEQNNTEKEKTESKTEKEGNNKNKNAREVSSGIVSAALSEEEKAQKEQEEKDKKLKTDFDKLYAKAKNGQLTEQDFNDLAGILKDPSNYDKLNITTGVIFNKSKVMLKAMANVLANSAKIAKNETKEKLNLDIVQANKENGYITTTQMKDWKGLTTLMSNPDKKVVTEELFERVVATKNRDELSTEEEKTAWDNASKTLSQYATMREMLKVYNDVSMQRKNTRKSWFAKKQDVLVLPDQSAFEQTHSSNDLSSTLAGQVEEVLKEVPSTRTTEEKELTK